MKTLLPLLFLIALSCEAGAQETHARKIERGLSTARLSGLDSIDLSVSVTSERPPLTAGGRLLSYDARYRVARMRIPYAQLALLAAQDEVVFISRFETAREELTTGAVDLTLNGLALVASRYPGLQGDSINLLVKERRFDPEDPDVRGRVFVTGLEAPQLTAHAGQMVTIIAGKGNTSPEARGAAPAARIGSTDFARLLPDPDSVFLNRSAHLQNHSYGTVVENFYGNEAAAYDQQTSNFPYLLHVFSSGNAGAATPAAGAYAGLAGVANLSGNFKQAKNVLVVGSVDSAAQPMPLSSRGPAYDGRIKPELVAYGEDGSSGAAALVSGTAALVQQAWKRKQAGAIATSSLIRAVLINSADDLANAGPDYRTGFGMLNAYAALQTVEESRVRESTVSQGGEQVFLITVLAGTRRLKASLAWTDRAAPVNSPKALINDLDLVVRSMAGGQEFLPWVLDPTPLTSALQATALRRRDTLNTVEQVTIDFPSPGVYEVRVKGTQVLAPQPFALAWQVDSIGEFYWTFPVGHAMEAGRRQWIRWHAQDAGPATVEYATTGSNWRTLGTVPDLSIGGLTWNVPDTTTVARLRIRFGNGQTLETDSFTISRRPVLRTGFDCTDSFLLYWPSLPGVRHELSALVANALQPVAETPDSLVILQKSQHPDTFYALTPVINGKPGLRSATVDYRSQGSGCYIAGFYLQDQSGGSARFRGELGTLYGLSRISLEKWTGSSWIRELEMLAPALSNELVTTTLQQGENRYRMSIGLTSGARVYSEVISVFYLNGQSILVYPNPVAQHLPVNIRSEETGRFRMFVLDMQGRMLLDMPINSNVVQVPPAVLAKGLYILRFTDRSGVSLTRKLLVQ